MSNVVDFHCTCEEGCNKGAFKKNVEDEKFTIFGNLNKNNCMILRYHGELVKPNEDADLEKPKEIYMYYTFDNNWQDKHHVQMSKCLIGRNHEFCINIDLEQHSLISFGFYNNYGKFDIKDDSTTYCFNIGNDIISDIMKRYGLEDNKELPAVVEYKVSYMMSTESTLVRIKNFFKSLFHVKDKKTT